MGYLKGKSALTRFDKHANLKYKFGNRYFWAEGYYVSRVCLNEATIGKYNQEQERHDIALDKPSGFPYCTYHFCYLVFYLIPDCGKGISETRY